MIDPPTDSPTNYPTSVPTKIKGWKDDWHVDWKQTQQCQGSITKRITKITNAQAEMNQQASVTMQKRKISTNNSNSRKNS